MNIQELRSERITQIQELKHSFKISDENEIRSWISGTLFQEIDFMTLACQRDPPPVRVKFFPLYLTKFCAIKLWLNPSPSIKIPF